MKKKKVIKIELPKKSVLIDNKEYIAANCSNDEVWIQNKRQGKQKDKDLITQLETSKVSDIFLNPKKGFAIHIHEVTYKDLEKLAKNAKKRCKELGSNWIHLSPDISFFLKGDK